MDNNRSYLAIDLKSFYASVECVDRGLNPLTAKLVVADESRTDKTICLAVTPALKAKGISGRARLYEVLAKVPRDSFIVAPPRMQKYMEISQKIVSIYARYVSLEDIHVYSIDEVFIDVTNYLEMYQATPRELACMMIRQVLKETGITATVGIGSNLYLAKIAMDIDAKRMPADADGVRVAELNEASYRKRLWSHQPLTDFWRIGPGYTRRLKRLGIQTMGDLAKYSLVGADKLYKEFGTNAELLIDHAWGWEPVTMQDIKNYHAENHSLSIGQVLSRPYRTNEARTVTTEMADQISLDLVKKGLITDQIVLTLIYDVENLKTYHGETSVDHYGRKIPKKAHGTISLGSFVSSTEIIVKQTQILFDNITDRDLTIRKIYIVANHIRSENSRQPLRQLDIFTDYADRNVKLSKEKRRQQAILKIKAKYGKNAVLRGINFEEGATARQRNRQIGGHRA